MADECDDYHHHLNRPSLTNKGYTCGFINPTNMTGYTMFCKYLTRLEP